MARTRGIGVVAVITLVSVCAVAWADPTLNDVRSRNAASQSAIATIEAHIEATTELNPATIPKSVAGNLRQRYVIDYARAGDKERLKESEGPSGVIDTIRDLGDGTASLFKPKRGGKTINQGTVSTYRGLASVVQPWEWALFQLPWCEKSLSQLLGEAEEASVKTTSEAGRPLIRLDIRHTMGRYEVHVDPEVNYLVRKVVADRAIPSGTARVEGEVLSFREIRPGVFFPKEVTRAVLSSGKWMQKAELTFHDVHVNRSLPANLFQRSFPPGTRVTNPEKSLIYTVGTDGRPGKAGTLITPSPAATVPPQTATPLTADADEGWPWHRYVLFLSVLAVAVGLAIIFWKRRKTTEAV